MGAFPISLDFHRGHISDIARLYRNVTGLRIALQPPWVGSVEANFKCEGLPWDDALLHVLDGCGLSFIFFAEASLLIIVPATGRPS